jgi:hypothetical protein
VAQFDEALLYKTEGCGFEYRLGFLVNITLLAVALPDVGSANNRNVYQGNSCGEGGSQRSRCVGLAIVYKFWQSHLPEAERFYGGL